MAVLNAEEAAQRLFEQAAKAACAFGQPEEEKQGQEQEDKFEGWEEHQSLLKFLESSYNVTTTYKRPGGGPFEAFRFDFFKQHAARFCSGLQTCFGYPVILHPTSLNTKVEERFHFACSGRLEGSLVPALHGTDGNNLDSIYQHGLMIPGQGNQLRVANGSAHGVGIYSASMDNPALSRNYMRGADPPVLVCGVLDSDVDQEVYHAGGALVIFDEHRIAPLFVARRGEAPPPPKPPLPAPRPPRQRRIREAQPTTLRRGPAKKPRKPRVHLIGVARFLTRRAARRRFGPLDLSSSFAAQR